MTSKTTKTASKKATRKPSARTSKKSAAQAGQAAPPAPAPRRRAVAKKRGATLVVRQVRSAIGSNPRQRATLRGLRLGRPGRRAELEDTQAVRGMIGKVVHLVTVEGA